MIDWSLSNLYLNDEHDDAHDGVELGDPELPEGEECH